MSGLTAKVEEQQGWHVVKLRGALTDGIEDQLLELEGILGSNVIFDCEGIKAVNSSGIAEWLAFRERFDRNRAVVMQRCPSVIVDVMNLMPAFAERTVIRSIFVPFCCAACGKEFSVHVEIKPGFVAHSLRTTQVACTKCQGALEPQVEPEEYLAFMQSA